MIKYFYLQLKRILKVFPFVLAVTLALFVGLGVIFSSVVYIQSNSEDNKLFKIALVGDTDSEYLQLGMAAIQTFDDTRFAMEFVIMTEPQAQAALSVGEVAAYVVIPEDFIENALYGDLTPIKYVTTPGATGIVPMFKNEITKVITNMLIYSERGVYGMDEALDDNGFRGLSNKHMTQLAIEYIELIFSRNQLLSVNELGISGGLTLIEYLISGLTVLLLMLIGLPYASVFIKKDHSLNRLLSAKGYSNTMQILCEYLAHFAAMLLLSAILFALVAGSISAVAPSLGVEAVSAGEIAKLFIKIIPVIIMVSAFNMLVFELASDLVSGITLHFFAGISLCYISGCFYPIYAFPEVVQKLSLFLPTGIAREYVANALTSADLFAQLGAVAIYAVLFLAAALFARTLKTADRRRAKA